MCVTLSNFRHLFNNAKCAIIGMIHIKALPGTPKSSHSIQQLVDLASNEVSLYKKAGVDGLLVENMFDIPYVRPQESGPEVATVMTRVCSEVQQLASPLPCGVQVLAGQNHTALAVALASGCQFIRAEGFAFAHVADEGIIEASAGPLLRYRKIIGAEHIQVFCDIKKKHSSHALTADVSLLETAKAVQFFLGDAVIITGSATGVPPSIQEIQSTKVGCSLPVLVGSGVDKNNMENMIQADGVIVGSHFKRSGSWKEELDLEKMLAFMEKVNNLRLTK